MPQMAPIAWLSLFILFTLIFMMFSIMNYFCYMPNTPKLMVSDKKLTNSMNWKW